MDDEARFQDMPWKDLDAEYQRLLRSTFVANKHVLSGLVQVSRKYRDDGTGVGEDVIERIDDMIELGEAIIRILGYDPDTADA